MATPLQSDQQLFDFIELHIITRQPRNVLRKDIARRADIRYVVFLGHHPNMDGNRAFLFWGN
jgi:hypothetical protein